MNTTRSELPDKTDTIRDFVTAVAGATGAAVRILSTGGKVLAASGSNIQQSGVQDATGQEVSVDISHGGVALGRLVARGGSPGAVTTNSLRPFAVAAGFLLARENSAAADSHLRESEALARASREAQDLISHRDFLEQIIENYPGILCVMDPPPDFRLVLANRRFTSMLAEPYASGEPVQGRTAREVSQEWNAESEALADLMARVYESGQAVSFEQYAAQTPDRGTMYWNWTIVPIGGPSSPDGAPGYVLLIANDVTDMVLARQQIQASALIARSNAEELDGVITQMAEGVAIFDERGEIKRMNPAAERLLGRGAIKGLLPDRQSDFYRLFRPDGEPYDQESLPVSRALSGETVVGEQMIVQRPNEEEKYITASVAPITNASGAITGVVGVFHDITQETMIDRLKNEFVSIVSHELRTPLTAIMGYSDLMLRGVHGSLSDRQAKALGAVRANANRLLHLINDLLDVSKLESGKVQLNPEPVDLASVVSRTLAQTRVLAAEAGITLHNYIPQRSLPLVLAEETKVQQIIENLLTNAIKFTPAGGGITFEAYLSSLDAEDPSLAEGAGEDRAIEGLPARSVVVSVTDTGSGLPPDQLDRIWDRFYQVDATSRRRSGGAGLGLAIVRSLAELHGGRVWAQSAGSGRGSTFSFSLPLAPQGDAKAEAPAISPAFPKAAHTVRSGKPGTKATVLVAEDDADQREIICEMLELDGYDVVLANDGEQALELAHEASPSAIILDVILPLADGWEVLNLLKKDPQTAGIPVLVISVVDQPGFGKRLGADEYLLKPLESLSLRSALQRLVNVSTGTQGGAIDNAEPANNAPA